jgi:hypothetical protein
MSSTSIRSPSSFSPSQNQPSQAAKAYLISPLGDSLMIGGASILVFLFYWFFVDKSASTIPISFTAFALSYVINWPHFLSSYQLLYKDYRSLLFKKPSFFWAAFVSPLLIIGILVAGVMTSNVEIFVFMVQGMYLSVGWHYVKQIYGTALVTSAVQKRYFDKWEKVFILLNLYSVWAMSWVSINVTRTKYDLDGISYYSLGLPDYAMTISYWVTGITFLFALGAVVRKYVRTGLWPATASLVSFVTIYCWYIPVLSHPSFFYMIPFFHSLQYILFVSAFKKNQVNAEVQPLKDPVNQRWTYLKKYWGFWVSAFILGVFAFDTIPKSLDAHFPMAALFGPTAWLFVFGIFINIHHYFIDNVIWRGDNPYLKQHLILASQKNIHE